MFRPIARERLASTFAWRWILGSQPVKGRCFRRYGEQVIKKHFHAYGNKRCFLSSLLDLIFFFFLWLYSRIFGLGRVHETFRSISLTRSRRVGRTPWTADQLVARLLLTAPGDCDDREIGGMSGFGSGNRSTRSKPAPTPLCPP
jgi:hypothetical protein